jgi:hypothetical protein
MRPEYRALLWKREPSFSVAVPDSEAVRPRDAGSFVSGSEIFPMKKADSEFDLDAECNFQVLSDEATETACKYEYMRESQALRDEIENFGTDWNREYKLFNHLGAIIASRPRHVQVLQSLS